MQDGITYHRMRARELGALAVPILQQFPVHATTQSAPKHKDSGNCTDSIPDVS